MDPKRILTFRAVAQERSFSRAAKQLWISQPSVSQQVALLEREIGTKLIDRGAGGFRLTEAGETLLVHADAIADRLELATTQLGELQHELRAELQLGAFPTALAAFVPSAVMLLRQREPGLRVRVEEVTPSNLASRFSRGNLHIAVSYQDTTQARRELDGAERVDLLQDTFWLALPTRHRLAGGSSPLALEALADEDWIVPSADGFVVKACRAAKFEPRIVSVTADPLAMRGLVAQGLAIAMIPSLLSQAYAGIALRPLAGPVPTRDVFALLPPGGRHPLAHEVVKALLDTAAEF